MKNVLFGAVVNVATRVEIRFGAVVLIEKLVFYVTYKKIGVAGSHFCAHSYTINLLIIVAGEWKNSLVLRLVQLGGAAFPSLVP